MLRTGSVAWIVACLVGCSDPKAPEASGEVFSEAVFGDPPREFRPQARWWWPGGAVDDAGLVAQLQELADLRMTQIGFATMTPPRVPTNPAP